MCRNSTGRRYHNVLGEASDGSTTEAVRKGNLMASKTVLILMYLIVRQIIFIVEQPMSSLLYFHHRFAQLDLRAKLYQCSTWLGAFGHSSAKGIRLLSNHPRVYYLKRELNRSTFKATSEDVVVPALNGGVSGGPALKASQQYPLDYARAVCDNFCRADKSVLNSPLKGTCERVEPQTEDLWEDANLPSICNWLGIPHDTLIV